MATNLILPILESSQSTLGATSTGSSLLEQKPVNSYDAGQFSKLLAEELPGAGAAPGNEELSVDSLMKLIMQENQFARMQADAKILKENFPLGGK